MKKCDVCVYVLSVIKVVVFFMFQLSGILDFVYFQKTTIPSINYIMKLLAICVRPFMLG